MPQPITSYEFRLFGDMTLKQFGKLAAGIVLALIVYGINPPAFIKWPLVILFAGLGAAMAFVPFEGRPIDVWIIAFFKRIYSPTQFIWKQKEKAVSSGAKLPQPAPQPSMPVVSPPIPAPQPPAPVVSTAQPTVVQSPVPRPKVTLPNIPPPFPTYRSKKVEATFSPNVVVPATPLMPNLIVGYVRDRQGKIIGGAILEIREASGNPVRAFKTNKLGQFLSATPLHPGEYEIETEKEGYSFDIIKVILDGKIMPPIEIVSKN